MRKNTHHRTRHVCLVPDDIRLLSAALAAAYPEARYYMQPTYRQLRRSQPPRLLMATSMYRIWQASCRWRAPYIMVPDNAWQPVWHIHHQTGCWSHWPPHHPFVEFSGLYGFTNPAPGVVSMDVRGSLVVYCDPGSSEQYRFADRFYRLFGKFASNRNLADVKHPSGETIRSFIDRGAWYWVGHEARRWAAEDAGRYLTFWTDRGLRPLPMQKG